MNKDNLAVVMILFISLFLLLLAVRKTRFRKTLLALLTAQFVSWPLTLIFVYFNLQINPVRFFPYATDGNFLFAFIFHPSVFVFFYLRYPQKSKLFKKAVFSVILPGIATCTQWLIGHYTNLIDYSSKWVILGLFFIMMILYQISRKYLDWFFKKFNKSLEC